MPYFDITENYISQSFVAIYYLFNTLLCNADDNLIDEHGRAGHVARESSPSPAGSNYTTASESDRIQNVNEAVHQNYEEKGIPPRQYLPNENFGQQVFNVERNLQMEQQQTPIVPIQEQASSTSSMSTIIAGNDAASTPPIISETTNDLKNMPIGTVVASNTVEDANTLKQEISSVSSNTPASLSKVRVIELNLFTKGLILYIYNLLFITPRLLCRSYNRHKFSI